MNKTPFHIGGYKNSKDIIKILIFKEADVNIEDSIS